MKSPLRCDRCGQLLAWLAGPRPLEVLQAFTPEQLLQLSAAHACNVKQLRAGGAR